MKCLLKAADPIRGQKEALALIETLESGKPISQAGTAKQHRGK
jgi:acyl-CoA reductase-like NAD-dependent aldehyde dehydrogenase